MLCDNFVTWSFLREICINISMFCIKRPKVIQPLLQICSNHYFHHPSNPCLHNQIGRAVNLHWLLRHHSCRRKGVWGPVGRERKAGSCHSSPLLSFFFFFHFSANSYPLLALLHKLCKTVGRQWWLSTRPGFKGVSSGEESWQNPQCEWHAL